MAIEPHLDRPARRPPAEESGWRRLASAVLAIGFLGCMLAALFWRPPAMPPRSFNTPALRQLFSSSHVPLDWEIALAGLALVLIYLGLIRLARLFRLLGFVFAAVLAGIPMLLWYGMAHEQGPAFVLLGIFTFFSSVFLWPAAFHLASAALLAETEEPARRVPSRRAVRIPIEAQDTMPQPRVLELNITEEDQKEGLLLDGRSWLITALAAPFVLYYLFSIQWIFESVGPRTLMLLWLISGYIGLVGVGRISRSRGMSAVGRQICQFLSLLPVLNILVFAVFLLLSFRSGRRLSA